MVISKTSFFSKRYFSATIIARDLISSSGCREFFLEHNILLAFFLVEGGVVGNCRGVVQNAAGPFFEFFEKNAQ